MKFDFNKFVKKIHSSFVDKISTEQLSELLFVDEDSYQKDSPSSTGKGLIINKIRFVGQKGQGANIDYSQNLYPGINIWIGENFKGKSSFFKIIKYAFTGKNTIEKDVKGWIKQIFVEFSLGVRTFTIHINDEGKRPSVTLYNIGFDRLAEPFGENEINNFIEFVSNSNEAHKEDIEEFFFKNFNFYKLKWTSKASQKDNPSLQEAKASWRTYFKSIYLESKDSHELFFGSQEELIFQMLLGLELTHPINRLKIKMEKLVNETGNLKNSQKLQLKEKENTKDNLPDLNLKFENINSDLEKLKKGDNSEEKIKQLDEEYNNANTKQNNLSNTRYSYYQEINKIEKNWIESSTQINNLNVEIVNYHKAIQKIERRSLELQEFIDLKLFFTSLEVHSCPHCDHTVEKAKKIVEKDTGKCMLCDHDIVRDEIDTTDFINKKEKNKQEIIILTNEQYSLRIKLANIRSDIEKKEKEKNNLKEKISQIDNDPVHKRIVEIEKERNTLRKDNSNYFEKYESLLKQKIEIEAQIKVFSEKKTEGSHDNQIEQNELYKTILEVAIENLKNQRSERSLAIIKKLEGLLLNQVINLGFKNISEVQINLINFRISFIKNSELFEFKELSEGEQLRIKLALYLSIIELDIIFNHGRHPRFLILDAPMKEEADKFFVEGLVESLKKIENNYKKELQIFIGTAKYELSDVVSPEKIKLLEPDQYLF